MAMIFTQTDSASSCASAVYCSGLSNSAVGAKPICTVGGSAGSTPDEVPLNGEIPETVSVLFECQVGAGATWGAGTWTIRLNVSTSNMSVTWNSVAVCRVSSGCSNIASLGSTSSLGISCGSTGVKTANVTGSSATPSAGDKIVITLGFNNSSMSSQSIFITPDQDIDSPFTQITPSLAFDPIRRIRPHLVRKIRDLFLGGLPPKLAKLSMVQNDEGLYVPQSLLKGV